MDQELVAPHADACGNSSRRPIAFTLIELLVVMAIIVILIGLVVAVGPMATELGKRNRAKGEIAALDAAIGQYTAGNGVAPRDAASDALDPRQNADPAAYASASRYLYQELSGDKNANGQIDSDERGGRRYFEIDAHRSMLKMEDGAVKGFADPWRNYYGYSTAYVAEVEKAPNTAPQKGYNPTFDIWSTAGETGGEAASRKKWLNNW